MRATSSLYSSKNINFADFAIADGAQGKALEAGMVNPSRLRVMGGVAKGRRLDSPPVQLRPMMGKVRGLNASAEARL